MIHREGAGVLFSSYALGRNCGQIERSGRKEFEIFNAGAHVNQHVNFAKGLKFYRFARYDEELGPLISKF